MVVLIRCNDVISDPRAMKYVKYLEDNHQEYVFIGWDREGKMEDSKNRIYYHKRAGFNVGGMTAVKNRIGWMRFVAKTLLSLKLKGGLIHACDLDAAYPAVIYNKLKSRRNKSKVLFDVFDWYSATLSAQPWFILKAFAVMEKTAVKDSRYIVICEPERIDQIPYKIEKERLFVLPNIPYFNDDSFLKKEESMKFHNDKLTFSYVGSFTKTRCINEIVTAAEKGLINLLIAGFGDPVLEGRLEQLKGHENIKYYGKVKYTDGLNIMYNSDVVYAMYSVTVPNHVYAAPNKYYEAMFLGKALFTTKGTIVERKTNENGSGFVSGESQEEIERSITTISQEDVVKYGKKARYLWDEQFGKYTENWLKNTYSKIIK